MWRISSTKYIYAHKTVENTKMMSVSERNAAATFALILTLESRIDAFIWKTLSMEARFVIAKRSINVNKSVSIQPGLLY